MSKRFTDTDKWDKEWYMDLSLKGKLLILFLFDKCDSSGVWSPNWMLASTYIGSKVSESDLKSLGKHVEKLPSGKYFIPDFIKFQYGELTESCPPHRKIISQLKFHNIFERVMKGYSNPNNNLQDIDIDKEEEEDKEEEKEKEGESSEIIYPFESSYFLELWNNWKIFRLKQHRFKYSSSQSEQAILSKLCTLSGANEKLACEIIKQSMENGWKGLFEIKTNSNEQSDSGYKQRNSDPGSAQSAFSKISSMYNNDGVK